jgi:hypothetical protein
LDIADIRDMHFDCGRHEFQRIQGAD